MATLRNLAISTLRLTGTTNIAKALRRNNRDPSRPLAMLGISGGGHTETGLHSRHLAVWPTQLAADRTADWRGSSIGYR
jgi:hypothetical protein